MSIAAPTHFPGGFAGVEFAPDSLSRDGPVVVWLHGIGERGDDVNLILKYGLPAALAEKRVQINATVLCPQLEAGREWDSSRLGELMAHARCRSAQCALLGFSLGALGVCELLSDLGPQANLHIAIAPRTRRLPVASQIGTHLVGVSGEHDRWPPAEEYFRQLRGLGARVEEVVLPNEGHFISETALWHTACVRELEALSIKVTHHET
jgi:predicted esterase